ncbi:MAG: molybdopterin dinucleotide binding domain-containing protein [Halobacteriota archaeon]|nr:molybdopterin dinucleotide binding domain-containing protein [Halobacteriota archaeon]
MSISDFLTSPEYEVLLITHSSIFQTEIAINDKFSDEYSKRSAVVSIAPGDMSKIGVKEGKTVKIENENGSVVVSVVKSEEDHKGIVFMPESYYSNRLLSPKTDGTGFFDAKKVKVKISKVDGHVVGIKELLNM